MMKLKKPVLLMGLALTLPTQAEELRTLFFCDRSAGECVLLCRTGYKYRYTAWRERDPRCVQENDLYNPMHVGCTCSNAPIAPAHKEGGP